MSAQLLEAFLAEARELLEQIGTLALELEQQGQDADLINSLFRAVHTLKGGSGLFDIVPFTQVVHAAEDILSQVREGQLELTPEHMDQLLSAMDQIGFWLDQLESSGTLDDQAPAISERFTLALRSILGGGGDSAPSDSAAESEEAAPDAPPDWLLRVPEAKRTELAQQGNCIAILYTPDEQCFFQGHDPLLTINTLPNLAWWQIAAREPWPELEAFDPYRCVLGILALSQAPLEDVRHHLRYVSDQIELSIVAASDLDPDATPAAAPTVEDAPEVSDQELPDDQTLNATTQLVLELLQEQRDCLRAQVVPELWTGRVASVGAVLRHLLTVLNHEDLIAQLPEALAQSTANSGQAAALLEMINQALERSRPPAPQPSPEPALEAAASAETPTEPEPTTERRQTQPAAGKDDNRQRVLKVDAERIDTLMDLVGELIVAKNALPFLARRAVEEFKIRPLSKEIKGHFNILNRIAEEMQGAVMQVRMIPVGTAFQRFPRLVRDISRKLGKQVQLELQGEDTEADKNVVSDLSDPLIHLVRNALDHGIETPSERIESGKPPTGRIRIKAHQQEDRVLIEINDDGRGMDPTVLKRKAYEKGLLTEEALERLTDQEALQLIFAAGFSTAESISDLSGRGVGMDVVRNAVQRASGDIILDSTLGLGTTVRLSLPLSMTVTQVMIIRVGDEDFGVIFDTVRETLRLPQNEVQRIKQHEAIILRERLLPLHRLDHLLGLPETSPQQGDLSVLVVGVGSTDFALVVDDVREGVDVILKPLEGVMSSFPLYAGTALLGDGRVLLVLNLKELLQCL